MENSDTYVRSKLGRDWIPAKDRCDLCKQVIEEETAIQEKAIQNEKVEDWIAVSAGECNWTGFADFDEVTISLAKFLENESSTNQKFPRHPLTVVYVCGLDHFNKCPYVASLAKHENIACAVIYRPGAVDNGIKDSSDIYYITLDDERDTLIDISSTAIRDRYRNRNNTDTNDGIYKCVSSFLQKHYSKK